MEQKRNGQIIIKSPDLNYIPDSGGLGSLFYKKMIENGNKIAQVDVETGEKDTYSSLLSRCKKLANYLKSRNVSNTDVISICSNNHINACVPFISSLMIGAKVASVDPTLTKTDTVYLLKIVNPKFIFVNRESVQLIKESLDEGQLDTEMIVFGPHETYINFFDIIQQGDDNDFDVYETADMKETALIFFSSGTTGYPKGICLNHYGFMCQSYIFGHCGINVRNSLGFATLYWISSALLLVSTFSSGGCRVIARNFNPNQLWSIIDRYEVSFIFLAPIQAIFFLKAGRPEGVNTTYLNDVIIGGGPLSMHYMKELREILPGTHVYLCYGQTELSGLGAFFKTNSSRDIQLFYKNPGSSGTPVTGLTYKVVNPENEELLGPNEQGELRIKTDFVMNGYYNLESSGAFDSDRFLKTGDIAYYDNDLCLYIVDRVKDMLKFQSWHVAPAFLEGILMSHPEVKAAVVIGIPHEIDGDHPLAVVVLKKDHDREPTITAEELVLFVEKKVHDRQRLRGGVKFVEQIPMTPSGKLRRKDIRDMVLNGNL